MKKGLPRFVLITDPYKTLEGRILIYRTQFPRYVFEINHPDEDLKAQEFTVGGQKYRISIRQALNDAEVPFTYLKDAVQWYHYSLPGNERSV